MLRWGESSGKIFLNFMGFYWNLYNTGINYSNITRTNKEQTK